MRRALLASVALVRLGVRPDVAHELVWAAIDDDPALGVERVIATIRARIARERARDAVALREATETISVLSARLRRLERAADDVRAAILVGRG